MIKIVFCIAVAFVLFNWFDDQQEACSIPVNMPMSGIVSKG